MALRKNTLLVLILISSFSIFIASISDIITVDIESMESKALGRNIKNSYDVSHEAEVVMSNSADNLMWFLQVGNPRCPWQFLQSNALPTRLCYLKFTLPNLGFCAGTILTAKYF